MAKLYHLYEGPYILTRIHRNVAMITSLETGKERRENLSNIK